MSNFLLSFDPSSSTGFAVFSRDGSLCDYGAIKAPKLDNLYDRADTLCSFVKQVISTVKPEKIVMEDVFQGHYKSAVARFWVVGTAFSICCLAASTAEGPTLLPRSSIKLHIAGSGRAKKPEIIQAVNEKYGLTLKAKDDDIADAIATGNYYLKQLESLHAA